MPADAKSNVAADALSTQHEQLNEVEAAEDQLGAVFQ